MIGHICNDFIFTNLDAYIGTSGKRCVKNKKRNVKINPFFCYGSSSSNLWVHLLSRENISSYCILHEHFAWLEHRCRRKLYWWSPHVIWNILAFKKGKKKPGYAPKKRIPGTLEEKRAQTIINPPSSSRGRVAFVIYSAFLSHQT